MEDVAITKLGFPKGRAVNRGTLPFLEAWFLMLTERKLASLPLTIAGSVVHSRTSIWFHGKLDPLILNPLY